MKIPKSTNRYCKYCRKYTTQRIAEVKGKERGSLKHGSIQRARKRGRGQGFGNKGKWGSKPPISKFKRTGAKISKKTNLKYICQTCKKTTVQPKGTRTKKLVIEQEK
ncbi:hypothetical protein J4413_04560 [Candidatus Woesearchaeota archaeon]|nr:hypothetical protein [Candidatus Woesearchaeota archaeon]